MGMFPNLVRDGVGVNEVAVDVMSLDQKIDRALADDKLVLRFNVGAGGGYINRGTGKQSCVILSSNKGSIMTSAGKGMFMRVKQFGLAVLNPNSRDWDFPPCCEKVGNVDVPVAGAVPSAMSLLMVDSLRVFLQSVGDESEVGLDDVWDTSFNFDFPLGIDTCSNLRDRCLDEAERRDDGKKLTRSIVISAGLECSVNGLGELIFKLVGVEVLSVSEPLLAFNYGTSGYKIGSKAYAQALNAEVGEDKVVANMMEKLGEAAKSFGSKNKRRADKKKAMRVEAAVETVVDTEALVELAQVSWEDIMLGNHSVVDDGDVM